MSKLNLSRIWRQSERARLQRQKAKGKFTKMSYLISFDPAKPLDFTPDGFEPKTDGEKPSEKHLFEAWWLLFLGGAPPKADEVEHSISLKREIRDKSIEGGSIKLAVCPCCGQRWMK